MTFEDGIQVPVKYDALSKLIGVQSAPDPNAGVSSNGAFFDAPSKQRFKSFH